MPQQKDLKRVVRSRMEKTGESYTAARVQVLKKKPATAPELAQPAPDFETLAGMTNPSVEKGSGRTWPEWVALLDEAGCAAKPHREIAAYVHSLDCPDWWAQTVTVGYERIRGLREIGQRRGGSWEASKSKTFPVPVEDLYPMFADAKKRKRWLGETKLTMRTSQENRTVRAAMADGTLVQFYFLPKNGKSSVAVQHTGLPSKTAVEEQKAFWKERLEVLGKLLEKS